MRKHPRDEQWLGSPTTPWAGETKEVCGFIKTQKPELCDSSLDGRDFLGRADIDSR